MLRHVEWSIHEYGVHTSEIPACVTRSSTLVVAQQLKCCYKDASFSDTNLMNIYVLYILSLLGFNILMVRFL